MAGSFESADKESIKAQFDTNLFGLFDVTRAFLPHFRDNKEGLFVNTSSIGGFGGFPFVRLYNSTKWAAEVIYEAIVDDSGKMRYLVGPDAEQTRIMRDQLDYYDYL